VNSPAAISIRPVRPEDLQALIPLCEEMEEHYRGPKRVDSDHIRASLNHALLNPATRCSDALVAEQNGTLVGFAVFSRIFPAEDMGVALFLKELFVRRTARRSGVAMRLLAALANRAREEGCSRLDWTTDDDNVAAKALYGRIGAHRTGKIYYRLERDQLQKVAELKTSSESAVSGEGHET
jgi:GNAT superfamily N-acetyltransferase